MRQILALFIACAALIGCSRRAAEDAMLLAQRPNRTFPAHFSDTLERFYPAGTRIALESPHEAARSLTDAFAAAGEAVVAPDAAKFYFTGKKTAKSSWQIYEFNLAENTTRPITTMVGGAANPALLPNGDVVFSSPVPTATGPSRAASLYAQTIRGPARQLTFGPTSATDPTVLRDGRILFVAARKDGSQSLFTINSDGTELTAFALDHDGAALIRKPRELDDGRIAFLSSVDGERWRGETVLMARPFRSRNPLVEAAAQQITSIEAGRKGNVICANSGAINNPDDWQTIEAAPVERRAIPIGHLSTMSSERQTGTLLCLNANFTRTSKTQATSVRVLAASNGVPRLLGITEVHSDGSFLVEVPADTAIGFETLDAKGQALRLFHPFLWVRPGENRSCVGCHEPYNHSPPNARPIAANSPAKPPVPEKSGHEATAVTMFSNIR